ncbi:MAG TPA: histidine phosphatase family protein [Dehalococcoidia bacterium]|nr:histidine phosphatase family protein [Dehalococcoidia bacterium]
MTALPHNPETCSRPGPQAALDELEALFRLDDEEAGELLLVRHARPAFRPDGEQPADALLSCEGLEQAERLADRLSDLWVDAIYSSPERRTFQTARIVADGLGRPLHILDALAEIEFEPASLIPDYASRFALLPRWQSLPGFEDGPTFRRRVIQAIEGVIARHSARRVVVVTHSSVINAYLSMLLGVSRDLFFAPDHASISAVRHQNDTYALRYLNDTSHLSGTCWNGSFNAAFTAVNKSLNQAS